MVLGALLVACWLLGGVTEDSTSADEWLQLLSLPVVLWAAWRVTQTPPTPARAVGVGLALAVLLLPAWQMLPLPQGLGMGGAARSAIAADLATAGVPPSTAHASLAPLASERALWSLWPALAMFLGALALSARGARRMLQLVLGLMLASAAFAFFQLSLPDGSPLLLFTTGGRNFGGLFANSNHQGNALILGAVIAFALFIDARRRARDESDGSHHHWLYAFLAVASVVMIPLANGTAAALLVLVALVAIALMMRVLRKASEQDSRSGVLRWTAALLALGIALASGLAWKQVATDRREFAAETLEIGQRFAPLGTGMGSFVQVFAQQQDPAGARREVINHAHNEYVQWWLEGGVPALLVLGFGLGLFAWCGWRVLAHMPSRRWLAVSAPAWCGLLVLLLHSLVDYPLRTTSLMATAGLLAGVPLAALAALAEAAREIRNRDHHDDAVQQA